MSEALKKVSAGFKLVYIGLLLVVLAVVINFIGGLIFGRQAGGANMLRQLEYVTSGLNFIGAIIGLVGRFKCMAVPPQAGSAKQMIVVSVALNVVSLLIALMFLINRFSLFLPLEVIVVGAIGVLVMEILAAILFLLFTRATGEYVRRPDLAATAMSVLWLWVTTFILLLVAMAFMINAMIGAARAQGGGAAGVGVQGACVGGIIMLAALIIGLVALIRYANLLVAMANATLKYARSGAYDYDEEYEDDRPRGRGRYDDEEEDRPRRSRRDDDEDEDDRPRKKRRDDDEWES